MKTLLLLLLEVEHILLPARPVFYIQIQRIAADPMVSLRLSEAFSSPRFKAHGVPLMPLRSLYGQDDMKIR